ncbi:unnamed protein product, partial [Acanthoscelides obtectus]
LGVRKLVSQQKAARVNWCEKTLDRFNSVNPKNVYSIVRGDESWIYCYEPENKRQSAVWMVATFVSNAGHIATIPLNEQRTVTADWYTTICFPKSKKIRQYLTEENVELLDHPPYSPDLSPNDFFTFPKIKNRMQEAVDAFKNAVLDLPANEWNKCFENWFERMQIIVFSDESRFCLGMHDGRARVRRRRGERRNPQFFVERDVHHTVAVMVWGAIAYGSRSPLIFIRGNMNAQRYIHEVLEPHLLPYLDTLADPTFQQDNARPHVARVTIDLFQHNDVTLLPSPPRSPDLSPIEHVWDMMGSRLLNLQRPPQTLEALREELVVAWNEIPQEDIDHLIRSMPRCVGECVAHQGASTHY